MKRSLAEALALKVKSAGKYHGAILWGIFIFIVVAKLTNIICTTLDLHVMRITFGDPLNFSLMVMAIALLVLHATWTLGRYRGLAFILLSSVIGWAFEFLGTKYGSVFGGHYIYDSSNRIMVLGVPWSIPVLWAAFIYAGYNIVTSFFYWINEDKPNRQRKDGILLPFLIFADGILVVAIDIFMEPLQVMAQNWNWLAGGPYYNIPIGNFVGWFVVTAVSTGVFRTFEYFCPQKHTVTQMSIFLIPVVGYGMLCLIFAAIAISVQLPELALTGFFAMFPIVVVNLMFFVRQRKGLSQR